MQRTAKTYVNYVTGVGPFPYDMLRYDTARITDSDALRIVREEEGRFKRPFFVKIHSRYPLTVDRWRSFLWTVCEVPLFDGKVYDKDDVPEAEHPYGDRME